MKRNARFWIFWKGDWVKITLKPEQTITIHEFSHTDEGWSSTCETYLYDGEDERVICSIANESRDCDGKHGHYSDYHCPVGELASLEREEITEWTVGGEMVGTGVFRPSRPNWQELTASQYDQYAETMGY